jgi:CRP/FNR family transcriptional regulator, cyclic AMP receptor protein
VATEGLRDPTVVVTEDLATARPFVGVSATALGTFALGLERRSFAAGEVLIKQGASPTEGFLLERGSVKIIVQRPGGGRMQVNEFGVGQLLGEIGLIYDAPRTASAVAVESTVAVCIDRQFFRTAMHQRNAAAIQLTRCILATLEERFRDTRDRLLALDGDPAVASAFEEAPRARRQPCSFAYDAFAPLLPFFKMFDPSDLAALLAEAKAFEVDRGELMFEQSEIAEAGYLVLRGALATSGKRGGRCQQLGVLGPGRCAGMSSSLAGRRHSASCITRSRTTVLEFPRQTTTRLTQLDNSLGVAFLAAVCADLARSLSDANNDLAGELLLRGVRQKAEAAIAARGT